MPTRYLESRFALLAGVAALVGAGRGAAQQPCTDFQVELNYGYQSRPSATHALATRSSRPASIAHGPEGFLALLPCGVSCQDVYSSEDGAGWEAQGSTDMLDDVRWGHGLFVGSTVVAAVHPAIGTSPDGHVWAVTWWQEYSGESPDSHLPVSWTGREFTVLIAEGVASGLDDWTVHPFDGSTSATDVAFDGQTYVIVGPDRFSHGPTLDRLETWPNPVGWGTWRVASGAGVFVAVGRTALPQRGVILASADGANWEVVHEDTEWLSAPLFAGSVFLVGGATGRLLTSSDGRSWHEDRVRITGLPPGESTCSFEPASWDGRNLVGEVHASWACGGSTSTMGLIRARCDSLGPTLVLPSAAHLDGAGGSRWRTDLVLHNPDWRETQVRIELLDRDRANPDPQFRFVVLPGGSSLRIEDVVGRSFGVTGAATLRITPTATTTTASARTYSDSGSGSYGQLIEAIAEADANPAGRTARLIGLAESGRDDAGFRTNLGLVSVSGEPMEVEVELRDGSGAGLGTRLVALEPWESVQLDRVFTAMTTAPIDAGLALVRTVTPSGRFFAYASVIDNRTHDPVYVPAR